MLAEIMQFTGLEIIQRTLLFTISGKHQLIRWVYVLFAVAELNNAYSMEQQDGGLMDVQRNSEDSKCLFKYRVKQISYYLQGPLYH